MFDEDVTYNTIIFLLHCYHYFFLSLLERALPFWLNINLFRICQIKIINNEWQCHEPMKEEVGFGTK